MSTDRVRSALRAAAAAHQPDRAAILTRIQRGQAATGASRAPRSNHRRTAVAAGMAATVAAVIGLSVAVTWAAVRGETPQEPIAAPSATTVSPAPAAPPSAAAGSVPSHGPAHRPPSAAQASRSPAASPSNSSAQQGFLWSSVAVDPHSIDNWAQSNVTLRNSQTVTALELRVRIALTPDVVNTGAWSTISADALVTTVEQQADALVYTFTLKPGMRLGAATHFFGVQYGHATGGRDPSRDTYQAVATADDGARAEVDGRF
ncbi:hypothetical protein GCM10023170_074660 [Phytohabitans houttuyneae]